MKKKKKIAIITLSIIIASNSLMLSQIDYSYGYDEIVVSFEKPFYDDRQLADDKLSEYKDLLWNFYDALRDEGLRFRCSIETWQGRY